MTRAILATTALVAVSLISPAEAKSARCYTSDDGEYRCEFMATDGKGSFKISSPGKPTFSLVIERAGVAFGFADFGSGSVPLPGLYRRSEADPACWVNDATAAELCAW